MKNLVLILGLVVALISDVGAMRSEKSDNNRDGIFVTFYRVPNTGVPICIFQARSKNIIQFGGMVSESIRVNCKEYNGMSLQSPVDIRYDMTQEELSLSLCKSFGVDLISYHRGIMSEDCFAKNFPFPSLYLEKSLPITLREDVVFSRTEISEMEDSETED